MRTTFNVTFYCRKCKANKNNQAPLEAVIIINGERKYINLPTKFDVDEYNKKRQSPEIKQTVKEWQKKVDDTVIMLLNNNKPITADTLRDSLRTGGTLSYTIEDCFEGFLKLLKKRVGVDMTHSGYRKYELTKELFFKHFDKNKQITTVTPEAIQNYYADLNKEYQPNSSASYMAKTKTILQFAIDNDKLHINPFQGVKIKREKKEIEYLTEEELDIIKNQNYSTEALRRVADVFLVQAYSGLAFVDLEALNKEDIQNENGVWYIRKKRVKTKVEYTAVLFPQAVEILKKYNFKLPIISNQKTNSALKAIARECGINKRVYDHLGRKTYGTLLINRSIRLEVVAKALGHSQIKTTAQYYASLHNSTIVGEIAKAI